MDNEILDAINKKSCIAEYQPFYAQLSELEKNNSLLVFHYETPKGNKEARSHIHTLRLTKGALERTRKSAKAESLRIGRAVDSEAEYIEQKIDSMISVHQTKLDEIENKEKERIKKHNDNLKVFSILDYCDATIESLNAHLSMLANIEIDDTWEEFKTKAAEWKENAIFMNSDLLIKKTAELEQRMELEKLRKQAEEQKQKDYEASVAKQAEEKAKIEAEQRIKKIEDQARKDREYAKKRELKLKFDAEMAEKNRIEYEQRVIKEKKESELLHEKKRLQAIQEEKQRIANIEKQKEEEKLRREADKEHRRSINNHCLEQFMCQGVAEDIAKFVICLIASNKIQHINIHY
jgi:colicin import membrane protein